ncbi:MAG: GlsB/YeaQ/YmgE family stress response membrane protein [Gemmatimonadota bacterium]|nr:MAG: GlsB/YeaQ/YmgE family stress response membrane protein [Gemmatimonadota bacterium]
MGIFSWIALGFIAGTVAKMLHPGRDPGGCLITILLGVGGALIGGYIGTRLGWGQVRGFDLRSMGLAVGGALLILVVYRTISGKRR